jgi:ketosteroid isomerase-like protein
MTPTRTEHKNKGHKAARRMIVTWLLAGAALIVVIPFAGGPAHAQSSVADEREAVRMTVDTVFEGWRRLDLSLYMSVWDPGVVQYLRKGSTRNYSQIKADRADSFPKYSRVDATWTADNIEVHGNKATVSAHYTMTFYKKDGKVITENEKEFYVLEKRPDMMWYIVENYDYLPKR